MANNVILLSNEPMPKKLEGKASEAITPGEMVELGGSNDYQRHSSAGSRGRKLFALSQAEVGIANNGIGTDIASGDTFQLVSAQKGVEIYALLPTGGSEVNISAGDALESAGDGTLQAYGTSASNNEDTLVAYALESVDNSSGGSEARIKVEVA